MWHGFRKGVWYAINTAFVVTLILVILGGLFGWLEPKGWHVSLYASLTLTYWLLLKLEEYANRKR